MPPSVCEEGLGRDRSGDRRSEMCSLSGLVTRPVTV